jgi:hypothetical protein
MGCCGGKKDKYPTLICFFETKNEEQKAYCIKLKDNFKSEKIIRFEIKSLPNVPFKIQFKIKDKIHDLQTEYSNEDDVMNETLEKAYELLKD